MADQRITDFKDETCSAFALGQLLGIAQESVARLSKVEGMPKVKAGHYPVVDCVQWAMNYERDKNKSDTPEDKKARIAVAEQQTLRLKIDNGRNLSELLPADIVASGFAAMASQLASLLDALGPRMAAELSAMDDPAKIQKVLFDECRSIRDSAAAAFAAVAGDVSSEPDTKAAARPKRRPVGRKRKSAATKQSGARPVANG